MGLVIGEIFNTSNSIIIERTSYHLSYSVFRLFFSLYVAKSETYGSSGGN